MCDQGSIIRVLKLGRSGGDHGSSARALVHSGVARCVSGLEFPRRGPCCSHDLVFPASSFCGIDPECSQVSIMGMAGDSGDQVVGEQSSFSDVCLLSPVSIRFHSASLDCYSFCGGIRRGARFASLDELPMKA